MSLKKMGPLSSLFLWRIESGQSLKSKWFEGFCTCVHPECSGCLEIESVPQVAVFSFTITKCLSGSGQCGCLPGQFWLMLAAVLEC